MTYKWCILVCFLNQIVILVCFDLFRLTSLRLLLPGNIGLLKDAYNSRDRPVKNIIVSPTMSLIVSLMCSILLNSIIAFFGLSLLPEMLSYVTVSESAILRLICWQFRNMCLWPSFSVHPNVHCNSFFYIFLKFNFDAWHLDLSAYNRFLSFLLNWLLVRYGWSISLVDFTLLHSVWTSFLFLS